MEDCGWLWVLDSVFLTYSWYVTTFMTLLKGHWLTKKHGQCNGVGGIME